MAKKKSNLEGTVNLPREIFLINDPEGYVRLSDKYLWIKFSDEEDELQFRIDGRELIRKFRQFREKVVLCKGVRCYPNELVAGSKKLLVIELTRPGKDNFKALVNLEDFRQVLYDFDAVKVVGY